MRIVGMKRWMVMMLFSIFFFESSDTLAQKAFLGIKAGGQTGSAFMDHTILNVVNNNRFKTGFHTGILFKYFPEERPVFLKSGVQFSLNYVQKGWTQVFITNEPTYRASMDYVELPVEAVAFFGNRNKYFATLGFYFEYLLDYKMSQEPDLENLGGQNFSTYVPTRDNKVGYGARTSAGIFREFGFGMLQLEGYFSYSISNFIDPGDLTTDTPDISNLWNVGASVAYLIRLSSKKEVDEKH